MGWAGAKADGKSIVCGHRGAPVAEPENTMASFHAAVDRGATWVEFDVRPTADGHMVIHHDPDTADGVHINGVSRATLPPTIPTLGELAIALPSVGLDVELKTDGVDISLDEYVRLVVEELDTNFSGATEQLLVTSFDEMALRELRRIRSDLATGLLFYDKDEAWALREATDAGHVVVLPWYRLLSEEFVSDARLAGLGIATWTVNEPEVVRSASSLGVDMIIGDDPALIVEHLRPV